MLDTFLKTYGDKSGDFLLGKDFSCKLNLPSYDQLHAETSPHIHSNPKLYSKNILKQTSHEASLPQRGPCEYDYISNISPEISRCAKYSLQDLADVIEPFRMNGRVRIFDSNSENNMNYYGFLTNFGVNADAEAATLPFLYRAHLLLKEYRDIDLNQLISDNKLNHLQKWQKVGSRGHISACFKNGFKVMRRI